MLKGTDDSFAIPRNTAVMDMVIIACLWWVSVAVVNPSGDFPLNDDWSFGLTVRRLMETGDFRPLGWTSMPLISNALWGSLFCIPAGFSFTALRLSTLTLSLLGILGSYLLMRDLRQPRSLAVITALTFGFNPINYALSNTFMTDVPCAAIMMLAALFLARNLRTGSSFDLFLGTAFAVAATLSRQLAVSIPLAFALSAMLRRGFRNLNFLRSVIPSVLCLGALVAFQLWLSGTGRLPELYHAKTEDLFKLVANPMVLAWSLPKNIYVCLLYLGWFLLPVLILGVANILRSHRKQGIAVFSLAIAAMAAGDYVVTLYGKSGLMPVSGNVIVKSGIGPLTLHDAFVLGLSNAPELPAGFWAAVTVLSLVGASLLITTLVVCAGWSAKRLRRPTGDNEAVGIFLFLAAALYLLPLFLGHYLDRYLIPAIPFLAAGIAVFSGQSPFAPINARTVKFGAVVILAAFSLFAVCGTRDYLEWNRGRWELLHHLMDSEHISAKDIDGGFEFNGFYLYNPKYKPDPEKSWWWVQGDTYRIAFGPIPGYTVVKEYNYTRCLPPSTGKVVALQKDRPRPSTKAKAGRTVDPHAP